ncbi:apolipoprotein N-acyltransferase [Lignipirellula cremea]|uniref:Apolipoprotein N-acyltransferase n=1 Tax=Lignipirellula cremea TaxID=2528010 RepID=A0A518DNQ0_9BACT|nr:apolipoprotein N-acyltransferase [Lignipirellula cremea]QDU93465.1 Apolipoprotein N-acyltransferase [Lignipirellula cremea]
MTIVKKPRSPRADSRSPSASGETVSSEQASADSPTTAAESQPAASPVPWYASVGVLGCAGSLLLWASHPPLGGSALAWVALLPWLQLIRQPQLTGRRPYLVLYGAGLLFWLMLLQFLRLPHPAGYLGWFVLSAYLAAYVPAFIGLSRVAVHSWRIPLPLAAAAVWTGLELMRAYFATGIAAFMLAHTQVAWLTLIQCADLIGGYGLSFLIVFCSSCLLSCWPQSGRRLQLRPVLASLLLLVAALGSALGYGSWRLGQNQMASTDSAPGKTASVALIQGSHDTIFGSTPEREEQAFDDYCTLTREARAAKPDLDLIIWPETMLPPVDALLDDEPQTPGDGADPPADRNRRRVQNTAFAAKGCIARWEPNRMLHSPDVKLMAGCQTLRFRDEKLTDVYNSVLLFNSSNLIEDRYFKTHRVLFGEYVPLADMFPWVYDLTPMPQGLTAGTQARAMEAGGLRWMPLICFESIQPQVVFWQQRELARQGKRPQVFVNLTNDGWFWGSSALDHHFHCNVFRAVEFRTPMVVAANTGFSGWIDGDGRVRAKGPRRESQPVYAEVQPDGRRSWYGWWGDLPASLMLLFAACCAVGGWRQRRQNRNRQA